MNEELFIPHKDTFDFVFNMGLCLGIYYIFTGIMIFSPIIIIAMLIIPALYIFSYILFFVRMEAIGMKKTYDCIVEEVKNGS